MRMFNNKQKKVIQLIDFLVHIPGVLMMLFWAIMLLLAIPAIIKPYIVIKTDEWSYYTIAVVLQVGLIYVAMRYRKHKKNTQPCVHGIPGGEIQNACPECLRVYNDYRRKLDIEHRARMLHSDEQQTHQRRKLRSLENLYSLSPYEFEDEIMKMYRALGYRVKQTSYSNDRGKDGIAFKEGEKYLIECKRYEPSKKIGRPHLQKFFAAIYEERAKAGFFITTSSFASTAYEYAEKNRINLIDGLKLIEMMHKAYPPAPGNTEIIRLMCLECGEIVRFDAFGKQMQQQCPNNHPVINDIQ